MPISTPSIVVTGHDDFELLSQIEAEIRRRIPDDISGKLGELVVDALEFVLDPVRTGRTKIAELDNVEKTFIGLKVEHFVRDLLDAPKGIRDLKLAGHDVDVKNTVRTPWAWMIPPETYRLEEPCLLIAASENTRRAAMGLIVARNEYLGAPNRDKKRGIKTGAHKDILWLATEVPWPGDRWAGIDMARFRELRKIKGGSKRAAQFFEENLRKPIHRSVVQALLFDQHDYMKRLRENKGARDILKPRGILLLSGLYDRQVIERLGVPPVRNNELIAVETNWAGNSNPHTA